MKPLLGRYGLAPVHIDIEALLTTRLVLTAMSGSGKSHAIRRILEQTQGQVQQIVIDPEGEFYTLREKFPYVLAGEEGDCPADVRSAELLAVRLMELRVSAIIDLYSLRPDQRVQFVKLFVDSLLNIDKRLMHPVLIVIDESHNFCPERGEGEASSRNSVIALMAQGRKKLMCPILATQRLSKLDKSAVAEAHNMMIGKSILDVDVDRAKKYLGFKRDQDDKLRKMPRGHFWTFGPAFCDEVLDVLVDDTVTASPKLGSKMTAPAPPTESVAKILGKLADLPAEAEQKAQTEKQLREQVGELKRQLAVKEKAEKVEKVLTIPAERLEKEYGRGVQAERKRIAGDIGKLLAGVRSLVTSSAVSVGKTASLLTEVVSGLGADGILGKVDSAVEALKKTAPIPTLERMIADIPAPVQSFSIDSHIPDLRPDVARKLPEGEHAILRAVAGYRQGIERRKLSVLIGYKRSSRDAYISRLMAKGLLAASTGGYVIATGPGIEALGANFEPLPTGPDLQRYWFDKLPEGEGKILRILVGMQGKPLARSALDEPTGYKRSSRDAYLSRLSARNLVTDAGPGLVRASEVLF